MAIEYEESKNGLEQTFSRRWMNLPATHAHLTHTQRQHNPKQKWLLNLVDQKKQLPFTFGQAYKANEFHISMPPGALELKEIPDNLKH